MSAYPSYSAPMMAPPMTMPMTMPTSTMQYSTVSLPMQAPITTTMPYSTASYPVSAPIAYSAGVSAPAYNTVSVPIGATMQVGIGGAALPAPAPPIMCPDPKTLPKAGTLGIASTEIMQFLYRIGGINYQDVIEIAQEFNKYECGISTVQQMLILEEKDVKECLKYQPLGKRKLYAKVIFQAIKDMKPKPPK